MANMIQGLISLAVGSIILASVYVPIVKGANTTSFTASELALWSLLTLVAIVGFVYGVLAVFGLA